MAQVRGTFSALYANVDKVVTGVLRDTLNELPAVWKKYFDIKQSDRKFERIQTIQHFSSFLDEPICWFAHLKKSHGQNYLNASYPYADYGISLAVWLY